MSEKSWNECLVSENAIKISPNIEKAKSILQIAEERINQSLKNVNEKNVNFVFEDYYSSLIEIIHATVFIKGYKVLNHICLGNYIKDILKREDLFNIFDDLRYKRNSLTYYGSRMDYKTAKQAIEKCKKVIKELKK